MRGIVIIYIVISCCSNNYRTIVPSKINYILTSSWVACSSPRAINNISTINCGIINPIISISYWIRSGIVSSGFNSHNANTKPNRRNSNSIICFCTCSSCNVCSMTKGSSWWVWIIIIITNIITIYVIHISIIIIINTVIRYFSRVSPYLIS